MAIEMNKVAHAKKYVVTWYQRIIQSASDQKYARGTTSSVGKNDYRSGEHREL